MDQLIHQRLGVQQERIETAARRGRELIEWPLQGAARSWPESWDLRLAGAKAYVYDGAWHFHTVAGSPFLVTGLWAGDGIALAGATCWLVVRHAKDHSATDVIAHSGATPPSTSGNYWYRRLYKLVSTNGGKTYTVAHDCRKDIDTGGAL